jgi:predicted nucleotide-binding protein
MSEMVGILSSRNWKEFKSGHSIAAAVVLATPDDNYTDNDGTAVARCRPNVNIETGFVIAHLTRKKLVYLRKNVLENVNFILPSNVQGVVYSPFTKLTEVEHKILKELEHITRK